MGGMEQFAKHERGGPSGPRLVTPGLDHDLRGCLLPLTFGQLGAKWLDVVVSEADAFSGDHDPLRIEYRRDACEYTADVTPGALDGRGHLWIAGCERGHVLRLDQSASRGEDLADDGRLGGHGFEATATATPTVRPARDRLDVADLAGSASGASIDGSIHDHAHADATTDGDDEEVRCAPAGPEQLFGDRQRIDVVVHQHWKPQSLFEQVDEVDVGPLRDRRI